MRSRFIFGGSQSVPQPPAAVGSSASDLMAGAVNIHIAGLLMETLRVVADPAAGYLGIHHASRSWSRAGRKSQYVVCPDCGVKGLPGAPWIETHTEHYHCPLCWRVFTLAGLRTHLGRVHHLTLFSALLLFLSPIKYLTLTSAVPDAPALSSDTTPGPAVDGVCTGRRETV